MGRAPRRATGVNDPANKMQAKLRGCAVRTLKSLGKAAVVAACFLVTVSTLHRWVQLEACGAALGSKPKSGRKRKLTADQQGDLQAMAAIRETESAKLAAAAYKKETGVDLCKQTAWRLLTESGHAYRKYRKVSTLSHAHRLRRLDFAAGHLKYLWSKVMWTDSKFFTLNTSCKNVGHYVLSSAPPSLLAVPKRGPSLHVYMGVTMFGLTRLVVVSGGSTPNKTYVKSIDKKTGRKNFIPACVPQNIRKGCCQCLLLMASNCLVESTHGPGCCSRMVPQSTRLPLQLIWHPNWPLVVCWPHGQH